MKYGLPYKGSKNKLAERIVRLLPRRTNLVDLFCGGCAVSHAAVLMGKFEHIYINDINWMCPTLFMDALQGKYANDTRWISREDFFRLRDTDPYVAIVWSFGNNMRDYLYSKEIEPLKKAIHYALFFSDYSLAKALGHDLSFVDAIKDVQQRYRAVRQYFSQFGHFQQQSFEGGAESAISTRVLQQNDTIGNSAMGGGESACNQPKQWNDSALLCAIGNDGATVNTIRLSKKIYKRPWEVQLREENNSVAQIAISKRPWEAEHRERTHCLAQIAIPRTAPQHAQSYMGGILPITPSVLSYEQVVIPKDSVIYCDIPYESTNKYNKAEDFDYERFYTWAESQTEPVFISSYQMPTDRFDCIEEFTHRSTLCATANNAVTERIFVPKHQTERGNICQQLTLF